MLQVRAAERGEGGGGSGKCLPAGACTRAVAHRLLVTFLPLLPILPSSPLPRLPFLRRITIELRALQYEIDDSLELPIESILKIGEYRDRRM